MKDQMEIEKFTKHLRKFSKEGLFSPIFFTIVFSFGILGAAISSEEELVSRIVYIAFSVIIIVIYWIIYIFGKRSEKEMNDLADNMENNINTEGNTSDYLSEEEEIFFKKKLKSFSLYAGVFVISSFVLSAVILIRNFVDFPKWLTISSLVTLGTLMLFTLVIGIIKYIDLSKYVNNVSNQ
ncbi:hypothetical protein RJI07_01045 [Mycoplasmatota bacterium WC30]